MGAKLNSIPQPVPFCKEEIERLDDKLFGVYLLLTRDDIKNPQYTRIGDGLIKSGLQKLLSNRAPGVCFTYVQTDKDNIPAIKEELLQIFKKWPPEN